jgi:hypothetical protein
MRLRGVVSELEEKRNSNQRISSFCSPSFLLLLRFLWWWNSSERIIVPFSLNFFFLGRFLCFSIIMALVVVGAGGGAIKTRAMARRGVAT